MKLINKLSAGAIMAAMTLSIGGNINIAMADDGIDVGDYLYLGTYNETQIKWRIIDEDENGLLVLSDKVIDYKMYDAPGSDTTTVPGNSHSRDVDDEQTNKTRQKYGSNYWPDSNLRSWLNSDKPSGQIEWLCGNPPAMDKSQTYQNTDGFLTNFTAEELELIKTVSHRTVVSNLDKGVNADKHLGTTAAEGTIDPATVNVTIGAGIISGYEQQYSQYVQDTIFIPDVNQLVNLFNNQSVFGDFYIPKKEDNTAAYTLYRTPSYSSADSGDRGSRVRVHDSATTGLVATADCNNAGTLCAVRPAFYLSEDVVTTGGEGTEESPYTLKSQPKWRIADVELTETGASVEIGHGTEITGEEKLLAAAYDINGKYIGVNVQNVSSYVTKYDFTFENMAEVNKVKVFMWNSLGMITPLANCRAEKTAPTIHIVSDSTAADWENPDSVAHLVPGETNYYPQSGWAMMLDNYLLEDTVEVNNKAIPGCTAQAFITQYLPALKTEIKRGDYVIIQFGHNDQKKYAPLEYKGYMTTLANEAVNLGASVIFVTSPVRLTFSNGELVDNTSFTYPYLKDYANATIELAEELGMPVVDLNAKSRELVSKLGEEEAKNLYLYLSENDERFNSDPRFATSHNNKELKDGTHLLPYGADTYAKIVAEGISELGIDDLSKYITLDHKPVKP